MSEQNEPKPGSVVWTDLTVKDADTVRDFYAQVVGWKAAPTNMGAYDDYSMVPQDAEEAVAGVCHARGCNESMPPGWMIYIAVESVDASIKRCNELGGRVVHGPRSMGERKFCVIQDPSGATCGLIGP